DNFVVSTQLAAIAANTAKVSCTTANVTAAGALMADGSVALAGRWDMFADVATDRWEDSDTNTYFGVSVCGAGNASGSIRNTFFGSAAGFSIEGGDDNSCFGYQAGYELTSGSQNMLIGYDSGKLLTEGIGNVLIGYKAGDAITTTSHNVGLGYDALGSATGMHYNIGIGYQAGLNSTALGLIAIGRSAGAACTSATGTVIIGYTACQYNVTGDQNTVVGYESGKGVNANSYANNSLFGYRSGYAITTGGNNVCVGCLAGDLITTGSGNIIIGYNVDPSAAGATDEINIGGTIFGKTDTKRAGVNVQAPLAQLHIDQSSPTAAIPVLILDQGDADMNFIDFIGTQGDAWATSITTAESNTFTRMVQVEYNGTRAWVKLYATPE
ncbi:MAG: hypothetical protein KKD77_23050, partial [Gammaproteobacteria bacterium]|nr:hypothetical protein [Gammaproteobacteria bacterium]